MSDSHDGDPNRTLECLLNLRSVRDQLADADLDDHQDLKARLAALEESLVDHLVEQREHRDGIGLLTVAVVGDFNSGKSTFINALLDDEICPVGQQPTTASVTYFVHGDSTHIEQELPSGTRKHLEKWRYRAMVSHEKTKGGAATVFYVSLAAPVLDHIRIVDTPGFNAPPPNENDTKLTEDAVIGSDVLFVLADATKGNPTKSLLGQLDRLRQGTSDDAHTPMFLLLNKAEELAPSERTEVKKLCEDRYGDRFRAVFVVSALQLQETHDTAPLEALGLAARRVRDAFMSRSQFTERISADVIATSEHSGYRLDVSGNVYDVAVSDHDLASRGQLADMVRSVSSERHVILERRFQRKVAQLGKDWKNTVAVLSDRLNDARRALEEQGATHVGDQKSVALEEIEDAKSNLIFCIRTILDDAVEGVLEKDERTEEKFWSDDRVFYGVEMDLDKVKTIAKEHERWDDVKALIGTLELPQTSSSQWSVSGLRRKLRDALLRGVREVAKGWDEEFRKDDSDWEYHNERWCCEYSEADSSDPDVAREELVQRVRGIISDEIDDLNARMSHSVIQPAMDRLQESVISDAERAHSRKRETAKELMRLEERIELLARSKP